MLGAAGARLWRSCAVSKGNAGGPPNGALISATERNTSGRTSAHQAATGEPKSCPTTAATDRYPSADTSPSASRTAFSKSKRAQVVRAVVVGAPAGRAAIAAQIRRHDVEPGAASDGITCRHE